MLESILLNSERGRWWQCFPFKSSKWMQMCLIYWSESLCHHIIIPARCVSFPSYSIIKAAWKILAFANYEFFTEIYFRWNFRVQKTGKSSLPQRCQHQQQPEAKFNRRYLSIPYILFFAKSWFSRIERKCSRSCVDRRDQFWREFRSRWNGWQYFWREVSFLCGWRCPGGSWFQWHFRNNSCWLGWK